MTQPSLRIEFTGQMSIVLGLTEYSPIEIRVDDVDLVHDVVRLVLAQSGDEMQVTTQTRAQSQRLRKLLAEPHRPISDP